jgi:hypothetical protein
MSLHRFLSGAYSLADGVTSTRVLGAKHTRFLAMAFRR